MFFLHLIFFSISAKILSLNPTNFEKITSSAIPTLVRFYTLHRKYSHQLDHQYDLVAEMFENIEGITIASVNCGKFRTLCYNKGVAMCPAVRLYASNTFYDYDGGYSHESISRWVMSLINVHAKELHEDLKAPNSKKFKEIINNTYCTFVMFYNPWCKECIRFLKEMKVVAQAFRFEKKVEIVANDVDLYKFFNWDYSLKDFPHLELYLNNGNEQIRYTSQRNAEDLLDFINDHCDTQRTIDGYLNSDAGLIEDVHSFVEDFVTKGKKPSYIKEIQEVEGTEYYVFVMNELLKNNNFVFEERQRLQALLDGKSISPEKMDAFKIRVNILSVFAEFMEE